uniref:SRR1-like domain-containing protein n=1 Tax=Globodera rostochiensis TaxID=31243 RepID=A0A914HBZ7_GLORO
MHQIVGDGWTLAARTKKSRRRRVFSAFTTPKCHANLGALPHNAFVGDEAAAVDSVPLSARAELAARMGRLRHKFPPKFRHGILCFVERILCDRPLALIRTFGIGPFENGIDSAYQLILLEAIKDRFSVPLVTSQDPVTTLCETDYLASRGITVLPSDDLLSAPPIDVCQPNYTLLFMIHCTNEMYDNVLSYYRHRHRLQNVILVGNDPNLGITSSFLPINGTNDGSPPSDSVPFANLCTFARQSVAFSLPNFEAAENAFHSTSISFLDIDRESEENLGKMFIDCVS